jgi:hypothetical protein
MVVVCLLKTYSFSVLGRTPFCVLCRVKLYRVNTKQDMRLKPAIEGVSGRTRYIRLFRILRVVTYKNSRGGPGTMRSELCSR